MKYPVSPSEPKTSSVETWWNRNFFPSSILFRASSRRLKVPMTLVRINSAGPFLLSNSGRRLYPKKVFRVVRSFFPGFSPHSLRHHFAIFLLNNSVPLPTIQYLLGHKHLDTTAIYLRYAEIFCVESVWHRFFISDRQSVREYGKSDKIVKISNWRPQ